MFRVYSPRVYNPMCKGGAWIIFVLVHVCFIWKVTLQLILYFILLLLFVRMGTLILTAD